MDQTLAVLKAVADDTRLKILNRLLRHSDCVGALARRLALSEAAVSQHLKVLREAGLVTGEKRGYFMHYEVNRAQLHALATEFETLAAIEREVCKPEEQRCASRDQNACHAQEPGDAFLPGLHVADEVKECARHGHCTCHES